MQSNTKQSRVVVGLLSAGLVGIALASCSSDDKKNIMPFGDAGEGGELSHPTGGAAGTPGPSGEGGSTVGATGGEGGALGGAPGLGGAAGEPSAGAGGALSVGGGVTGGGGGTGGTGGTGCGTASTGRITIAFDTAGNAEHVTNLQWLNSASVLTSNLIAQGGPSHCTDPQEFFGQCYGAPEGTQPLPVIGGGLSTLAVCGLDNTITSAGTSCEPVDATQIPVTTQYHFYTDALRASEVRITRTVTFAASNTAYVGTVGLRPFVPRVPLGILPTVIYPNQAGTSVTTTPATSCGGDCFTPTGSTWSGHWFADIDPTSGLALIVLRDPSMTAPVQLTINYDAYSSSNLASFVLVQPADGWTAPITETEYLCFADLTSWPQTARDAATLPAGCEP